VPPDLQRFIALISRRHRLPQATLDERGCRLTPSLYKDREEVVEGREAR